MVWTSPLKNIQVTLFCDRTLMFSFIIIRFQGFQTEGRRINNLRFADDIDLIEESRGRLQESLARLAEAGDKAGLQININKMKTMVNGRKDMKEQLVAKDEKTKNTTELCIPRKPANGTK